MRRRARAGAALLILVILSLPSLTHADARQPEPTTGATPEVELVAQTPVVEPGGTFVMRLRLTDVPDDGSVRVIVHQRVRSRSELAQSMEGEELRSEVFDTGYAISELPLQPDGSRRLAISLDAANGGLSLSAEGVYPVEVIAQDAAATPIASLITHLVMGPGDDEESPSLGVAVVAQVGAPPALQPDGAVVLPPADVEDMAGVVAGLQAVPDVPVSVAARPETIDALLASPEPTDVELVAALRASVQGRAVLALPYVEVSPDSLEPAGLLDQLGVQMTRGVAVLTDELGVRPVGRVALSPPSLGRDGLAALAFFGADRVVVASDQVAPSTPAPSATRWPSPSCCPHRSTTTPPSRPPASRPSPPIRAWWSGSPPTGRPDSSRAASWPSWPSCASSSPAWPAAWCSPSSPRRPPRWSSSSSRGCRRAVPSTP